MPLRRDFNGGWKRLSQQEATAHDRRQRQDELRQRQPRARHIHDEDNAHVQMSSSRQQDGSYHEWASEGIRRVRSDVVLQKMKFLTGMAALGGFLFGYDTGVVSGAMLPLKRAFDLTPFQQEVIVSSTVLAAFGSSLVGGSLNQAWGRRRCIVWAASIFLVGSVILLAAWNYAVLVVGRVVVGIGIGLASLTTPIYIAEVAAPHWRGTLVTVNAFLVTVGQFAAGMVDGAFDEWLPDTGGWRYMLGLAALPAAVMLWGFVQLPESPRWLASQGAHHEALLVLCDLRDSDDDARHELLDIQQSLGQRQVAGSHTDDDSTELGTGSITTATETEDSAVVVDPLRQPPPQQSSAESAAAEPPETRNGHASRAPQLLDPAPPPVRVPRHDDDDDESASFVTKCCRMVSDGPTRRALYLGCGLMLVQQCCGINTVMYYAASIYQMSQFDERTAVWLSGFTALAQVIGIGLSIYLVDRTGRRRLVLLSLAAVTVSLLGLGCSFYAARIGSEPVRKGFGACAQVDGTTWGVWNGQVAYCYDCTQLAQCGFCGGHCVPGTADGPDDLNLCPTTKDWRFDAACDNPVGHVSVFFMVAYLLAFGVGMGGMPWTITSEIYPLRFRSLAVACSTATNWIGNWIVAATFLSLSSPQALTAYGAFWLYAGVALLGLLWLYWALPETKGLSLEDIESLFAREQDNNAGEYNRLLYSDDDDDDSSPDEDGDDEEDSANVDELSMPPFALSSSPSADSSIDDEADDPVPRPKRRDPEEVRRN